MSNFLAITVTKMLDHNIIRERRIPFVTWQFTEGEKGQRDYY